MDSSSCTQILAFRKEILDGRRIIVKFQENESRILYSNCLCGQSPSDRWVVFVLYRLVYSISIEGEGVK